MNTENNHISLVIGASENPQRYANMAIRSLLKNGKHVVAIGNKEGEVQGVTIHKGMTKFENIHTITLYINPRIQREYYDYILDLHPKRIIFNPGTENPELEELAKMHEIETLEACTLVLLSLQQY